MSLSDKMSKITNLHDSIEEYKDKIESCKDSIHKELEEVLKENGGARSFKWGDKYFSIRKRGDKYFICSSTVPFGSWARKK